MQYYRNRSVYIPAVMGPSADGQREQAEADGIVCDQIEYPNSEADG